MHKFNPDYIRDILKELTTLAGCKPSHRNVVLLACRSRDRICRSRFHENLRLGEQGSRSIFVSKKIHWTIIYPLLRPPFFTRNPGKFEVLSFKYLSILASLKRPTLKRAIEMKSADLATYSPWKLPALISWSSSNPSELFSKYHPSSKPMDYQLHYSFIQWEVWWQSPLPQKQLQNSQKPEELKSIYCFFLHWAFGIDAIRKAPGLKVL